MARVRIESDSCFMEALLFKGLDWVRSWPIDPAFSLVFGLIFLALGALAFLRARWNYHSLPELAECAPQPQSPDCMVVIPARNEAGTIGRAIRSLPADSVIVVDDMSTDHTVKEAEAAGAGVLRIATLPDGAVGKPYACMIGGKALKSKWLMFCDADTWYEEGMIESAIHSAEANDLPFLSVHLRQQAESFAEHVLVPFHQALFYAAINPRKYPEGAFLGHCILVRRSGYEFIGGHSVGLTYFIDDVKLAQLAQRHRMRVGLARTTQLGYVRMFEGWKGAFEGIWRASYRFTILPAECGGIALGTAILLWLWLPMALFTYAGGWMLLAALILLLPFAGLLPWYGSPIRVLLVPVAIYAMVPIALRTMYSLLTTRHLRWKGRQV